MPVKPICASRFPCTRQSVYDTEELTALELAATTAQKTNETIDLVNDLEENVESKAEQTDVDVLEVAVKSNTGQIDYLTDQFNKGQTGFVINGGYFPDSEITAEYNGGEW